MKHLNMVYLVEDDVITTFLIKTLMKKFSFADEIEGFQNGEDALNALLASSNDPDMLFLDLNMPVMDGWEFLKAISKHPKYAKLPIYILTSSIDPTDKARSTEFPNVKGYLVKPLSLKDLQSINPEVG
ncbi:response regulator [Leptospira bandrabouensis]|uniref:Response regulator n=1 Tax=Leptospira bandrabouensis TaxID=2484903 RepID=A0A6H3NRC9_9LEPT|nr:response regulator [Leptospira bandrabouensis]MCG6146228.1 response regulator [Leptospira bandrabouensis]MCG6161357.1 response regulator [Leptospira bandrabouensis]MCG6165815.1 response regulator [Leptospira bandrabouensis]MCW7457933.1 response regulator [Leptospira bandrabouensis]MCW7479062.1 response regulator [Leptospira bandrabouensis]